MKLCMATNNRHKIEEIKSLIPAHIQLLSLADIGCDVELPETGDTLEANSLQKARYVWDHYQVSCFADDTGLEVESLDGEPGVYSARYAGSHRSSEDNIRLLLQKLQEKPNRNAQFRTCITLILDGKVHQFDGVVKGQIIEDLRGRGGFGYDPVFIPEGHSQTFAEMPLETKNQISHRGRAVGQLVAFLGTI